MVFVSSLSFLPGRVKATLHTRGPLHAWAHLYLFAAICSLLLESVRGIRAITASAGAIAAFGLAIEVVQARVRLSRIEYGDVSTDLVGVLCGVAVCWLRSAALSSGVADESSASSVARVD